MHRIFIYSTLVVFFYTIQGLVGLKSMRIRVPEVVKSGETVTLSCDYDLEQAALYTTKWYWNDVEFYRYVPKESPPFRAFNLQRINVDVSRSGPTQVTLRGVQRALTGLYKCEVTADAPLFHTDIKMAHMIVAELPNGNPVINIEPAKIEIGKRIVAECYSPGSDPPANLTWYINGIEISEDDESVRIVETDIQTDSALGLHSSKSQIEVTTNRGHFPTGRMLVKCVANIYTLWSKSVEDFVMDDTPQLAPVLDSTSSQNHLDNVIEIKENCAISIEELKFLLLILIILIFLR